MQNESSKETVIEQALNHISWHDAKLINDLILDICMYRSALSQLRTALHTQRLDVGQRHEYMAAIDHTLAGGFDPIITDNDDTQPQAPPAA